MSYIQSNAIIPIAANTTLTAGDSGKIFMVDQTAALVISLPAVATSSGVTYKFILSGEGAQIARIQAAAGTPIVGHTLAGPIAANSISVLLGAGTIGVNFGVACRLGDTINLYCNGTNWFAEGYTGSDDVADGISFS